MWWHRFPSVFQGKDIWECSSYRKFQSSSRHWMGRSSATLSRTSAWLTRVRSGALIIHVQHWPRVLLPLVMHAHFSIRSLRKKIRKAHAEWCFVRNSCIISGKPLVFASLSPRHFLWVLDLSFIRDDTTRDSCDWIQIICGSSSRVSIPMEESHSS